VAQGTGDRRDAAVCHQAPADLCLDRLAKALYLVLMAVKLQPPQQGRLLVRVRIGSDQACHQLVRVDGSQGTEHVVGASDGPTRLDRGVPVHEDARDGPDHGVVPVEESS
jgi:hypothetical protein